MVDTNIRVAMLRECSKVERCHTNPHHGSYTNGQHSFDMMALAVELMPDCSKNMMLAIMYHDFPERWTGDVPSLAKSEDLEFNQGVVERESRIAKAMGWNVELTDDERVWLKAIDKLELYLWAQDQGAMGNLVASSIRDNLAEWFAWNTVPREITDFLDKYQWIRTPNNSPR